MNKKPKSGLIVGSEQKSPPRPLGTLLPRSPFTFDDEIKPYGVYTGANVLQILEQKAVRVRFHQEAMDTLVSLLNAIDDWINRVGDVASVLGPGQKLAAYVKARRIHSKLIDYLHHLTLEVERQQGNQIHLVRSDSPEFLNIITFTEGLARCAANIETGSDPNGKALCEFIAEHSSKAQALMIYMRKEVSLGGAEAKPELQALYRIARQSYEQHKGGHRLWEAIANDVWQGVSNGPADQLSTDEGIVLEAWRGLTEKQRREQLRGLFRSIEQATGEDGL